MLLRVERHLATISLICDMEGKLRADKVVPVSLSSKFERVTGLPPHKTKNNNNNNIRVILSHHAVVPLAR